MKLPRDLSGAELIKTRCKHFGYCQVSQEGSHVILQTESRFIIGLLFPTTRRCGLER